MLTASQVSALGLGEMALRSFLNEPLDAEVELLDLRDLTADDIRIRLAGVDDFDRLGIDRSYFLTSIEFDIAIDDVTGRGVIRLSTEEPVLEPYLDLVIEARWPTGRLLREYTVLVDPPTFRQETVVISASEEVAKTDPAPQGPAPAPQRRDETVTRGDTVRRLESDLPPGEMPDRPFSAQTSEQPQAGSRYMVKRDETLWQIASRARPDGVAVQQAMLDIQRLNPEAFIDGNINRIKAGYIIYLPRPGDISSDDLAEALEEVRQQNQEFAATRREPGVTAAASLRVSADPAPEEVAETEQDAGDATAGVGSTQSSVDAAAQGSVEASTAAPQPQMPVNDSALAAQLNEMTARLDTLEQIVALKDEQIAALEAALREARESAATNPAPATTAAPQPTQPAATPAPARPAPASPIPWLPIAGGVAVILALLALLLVRRRRAEQEDAELPRAARGVKGGAKAGADDDVFAGVQLKKEAIATAPTTAEAIAANVPDEEDEDELQLADPDAGMEPLERPAPPGRGGSRGYGERKHDDYIDEGSGGDALAEADIYIAYGRYLQAIELLNTAIESEPQNSAYRLKLIELYVDMGEDDNAAEQLEKLRASGDREAILRGEALVGGGGAAAATVADDSAAAQPMQAPATALDPEEFETVPELDEELAREPVPEPETELDLDASPVADDAAGELPLELDPAAQAEDMEQDLNLDLEEEIDATVATPSVDDSDDAEEHDGVLEFDDLQIDDDETLPADDGELDMAAEEELDLSDALAAMEALESQHDEAESKRSAAADEENGDLVYAEDADQMATKLDLARAYLDMGDSDGARVILEEVISAGSGEQQQEARELLSRID